MRDRERQRDRQTLVLLIIDYIIIMVMPRGLGVAVNLLGVSHRGKAAARLWWCKLIISAQSSKMRFVEEFALLKHRTEELSVGKIQSLAFPREATPNPEGRGPS